MFTGIIEEIGTIEKIEQEGSNFHFCIQSDISDQLKVDQSTSHDGVCLTVTKVEGNRHWVTAIKETMERSNLGQKEVGSRINLERCMKVDGRFDGHIVQGHVDTTARVTNIIEENGSWLYDFEYDSGDVMVEKGSICVNGISLTCFNIGDHSFRVAIIPYTYENTNFHEFQIGTVVNLEFDIIGKYVRKLMTMT
jgi:riboflavin synthase